MSERSRSEATTSTVPNAAEMSVFDLLAAIVRHRLLVIALPLVVVVLTIVVTMTKERTFTSSASFAPRVSANAGTLPSLAAQLGVTTTSGDPTQQPIFYEALLRSPTILRDAVLTRYHYVNAGGQGRATSLVELYQPSGSTPAMRREQAVDVLRGQMSTFTDGATGVVLFTVKSASPELSLAICRRLLDLLNAFNLERRRSQASAERDFTRSRLEKAQSGMSVAEERLRSFRVRNRLYDNDPTLALESDRLTRDLSLKQSLYTALAQRLEQAEVDAVRDTPIINVIETPVLAARPDRRALLFKVILAFVLSTMVALLMAIAPVLLRRLVSGDREAYGRFTGELENAMVRLRALPRAVRRRNTRSTT